MSDCIRVVPEDVHVSAAKVDTHAEELQARHAAAHSRIDAAQPGVPAAAAAALGVAVAKWRADTQVLFAGLTAHGKALAGAGEAFAGTEERNAANVASAGL